MAQQVSSLPNSASLRTITDGFRVPTYMFADLVRTVLQNDQYLLGWFEYCLRDPVYAGWKGHRDQAEQMYYQQTGMYPLQDSAPTPDWVSGACYSVTNNDTTVAHPGPEGGQNEPLSVLIRRAINNVLSRMATGMQIQNDTVAETAAEADSDASTDFNINSNARDE